MLIPKPLYSVVEWEYGSEKGSLHIDGITDIQRAKRICLWYVAEKYKVDHRKIKIKSVFCAGESEAAVVGAS
ncbi:unnamed protein product [marine sediment metagenome]|uniref:Uncharacterized protein n=1 Tax=marine sediment metagenome TaxID=412755 RepID=X0SD11_9ZZZZ